MKRFNNGLNLSTIKHGNRSLILRVLNLTGQMSRADLSRITGLTKTSITNIINELLDAGIIYETGTADSSSGRKPVLLKLAKDALYSVGVYISRDFAYSNIVNLKGEIIHEAKDFFEFTENKQSFLSAIYKNVEEILKSSAVEKSRILGIGIASIGPLDLEKGIILDPPNFRGLKSIPIVESLKETFKLEVFMDNDMNASAIAEKLFGNAKNFSDFIYVGVTNGVGAGVIIKDNVFKGHNGFAGEIGHTTIDVHGERCACGNIGCLELYAGIPGVVKQVKASIELGVESGLSDKNSITWDAIVSAALNGDQACLKAIDKLTYYLSIGLVNTINSFDPEVIFLGHDIALAGELVTKPLSQMINSSSFFRSSKHVNVELSAFKEYAPCMGAPSIVLNKFFNGEI